MRCRRGDCLGSLGGLRGPVQRLFGQGLCVLRRLGQLAAAPPTHGWQAGRWPKLVERDAQRVLLRATSAPIADQYPPAARKSGLWLSLSLARDLCVAPARPLLLGQQIIVRHAWLRTSAAGN